MLSLQLYTQVCRLDPAVSPQLVRDAFKMAKEKIKEKGAAGAIIFIDEVCKIAATRERWFHPHCMLPVRVVVAQLDAIGTKRYDNGKSGDREVQRTMLELLNQLDGFTSTEKIKVPELQGK